MKISVLGKSGPSVVTSGLGLRICHARSGRDPAQCDEGDRENTKQFRHDFPLIRLILGHHSTPSGAMARIEPPRGIPSHVRAICCRETRLYLRGRLWPRRDIRAATKPPIRWIISANPRPNRSNCHVDAECCFSRLYVHRRRTRNSLTHIPGDEGWPLIGKTLEVLADPKGQVERQSKKYGLVYRSHLFGETSLVLLGPEANELVLFDQAKQFSSTLGWGPDPRPAVSARADAAGFRGASPAPPRAVGRLQVRADEVLSRRARYRHRGAGGAMEGAARTDAVLSRDEAAHARPRGDVVSRRRYRPRGRRDHPRLRRHGGGFRRRDPQAAARHADGARRQGPQAHRRLFLRTDSDPPRERRRRRSVLAAVPGDP